jgi:hypothetical protein
MHPTIQLFTYNIAMVFMVLVVPHGSITAQQAFSTHLCECGESKNLCMYSCRVVLCVVLAEMYIS